MFEAWTDPESVTQDPDIAKQHAEMGFHEGWGTVVDQLVEHVRGK